MRRPLSISLILLLSLQLVGCEATMRKFTRKTKREPIRPIFYQEGMEDVRPHYELYMMHYTYWKSWNDELVANAGKNFKKDEMAVQGAVGHLEDMKKYLTEEKAKELDVYIAQVRDVTGQMMRDSSGAGTRLGYLKQKLGNVGARIARKFYHKKIREFILPDKE